VVGESGVVTVLLGGDVMLGRGVDQILPHPGDPELREPYLRDARGYVGLAEHTNGPIPRPVDWRWPWGEVLALVEDVAPDVRLINLETTITAVGEFAVREPVCYRMHPDNLPALTALRADVCALANNHILDFGYQGMTDTVAALSRAEIEGVGAGADLRTARRPAAVTAGGEHRVLVGSVAMKSAGVPESWAAHRDRPGVWLIRDPSDRDVSTRWPQTCSRTSAMAISPSSRCIRDRIGAMR
jgi:poly-gamma-glutamate synthesis protein (capsule biosynthesis protein)